MFVLFSCQCYSAVLLDCLYVSVGEIRLDFTLYRKTSHSRRMWCRHRLGASRWLEMVWLVPHLRVVGSSSLMWHAIGIFVLLPRLHAYSHLVCLQNNVNGHIITQSFFSIFRFRKIVFYNLHYIVLARILLRNSVKFIDLYDT